MDGDFQRNSHTFEKTTTLSYSLIFPVFSPATRCSVIAQAQAESPATATLGGQEPLPGEASILIEAHQLALTYGIRSSWQEMPLGKGEVPPADEVNDIIVYLIPCENVSRLLRPGTVDKVLDSNDRCAESLLMFQSSTWQGVEAGGRLTGSPLDTIDAIQGARWSIEHGYLGRCSCPKILRNIQ